MTVYYSIVFLLSMWVQGVVYNVGAFCVVEVAIGNTSSRICFICIYIYIYVYVYIYTIFSIHATVPRLKPQTVRRNFVAISSQISSQ